MKIKSMKSLYMIVIGFGAVLMAFNAILSFWDEIMIITTPECQAYVKVVDRRVVITRISYSEGLDTNIRHYLATFEFPDGVKKEFQIGRVDLYAGNTGTLTYHESKFIENIYRETDRWQGRQIISFEKDSELGGTKIIRYDDSYSYDCTRYKYNLVEVKNHGNVHQGKDRIL